MKSTDWTEIKNVEDSSCLGTFYFFDDRSGDNVEEYCSYVSVDKVFSTKSSAVQTKRDELFISFDRQTLRDRFSEILAAKEPALLAGKYPLQTSPGWSASHLTNVTYREANIRPYAFRPFDQRYIYYDREALGRARFPLMKHMLKPNLGLAILRQVVDDGYRHVFVTDTVSDINLLIGHHVSDRLCPLYLYDDLGDVRTVNLASSVIAECENLLGLNCVAYGKSTSHNNFGPEDIFNYMYAVFHSPEYRRRYAEFLKIDFPRLPLTSSVALFRALAALGERLVALHLMKPGAVDTARFPEATFPAAAPKADDGLVDKVRYQPPSERTSEDKFLVLRFAIANKDEPIESSKGRVWINKTQYFDGVPPEVWEFHIGGYQVCAKWLKDRKGRRLSGEDIDHYSRVVATLAQTRALMAEIDAVIEQHGGWPLS